MFAYGLEHVCSYSAQLQNPPEVIGPVPEGIRVNFYLGEDGYHKFLQGALPPRVPLRVVSRFQTAHPTYLWLNRLQCLNIGEANLERFEVRYDVYVIR